MPAAVAVAPAVTDRHLDPSLAFARHLDRSLAVSRAAFALVLDEPCHAHGARIGQPCWSCLRAVCGGRVATAMNRAHPKGPPPLQPRAKGPRPFRTGSRA